LRRAVIARGTGRRKDAPINEALTADSSAGVALTRLRWHLSGEDFAARRRGSTPYRLACERDSGQAAAERGIAPQPAPAEFPAKSTGGSLVLRNGVIVIAGERIRLSKRGELRFTASGELDSTAAFAAAQKAGAR
jgi:hypothetical protein